MSASRIWCEESGEESGEHPGSRYLHRITPPRPNGCESLSFRTGGACIAACIAGLELEPELERRWGRLLFG